MIGQCRRCMRRREVYRISRSGGGTYRRGSRSYWSSICGECVIELLPHAGVHGSAKVAGFSVWRLVLIAESLPEGRAVAAAWRQRKEADQQRRGR